MVDEAVSNSTELTDDQVTELYDKVNAPTNNEIPMSAKPEQAAEEKYAIAEGLEVSKDDLMKYARSGHEYQTKMEQFQQQQTELEQSSSRYKEIDEFATGNPEWWDHVQKSYNDREQNNDNIEPDAGLSPELQAIQGQITEISKFIDAQKSEMEQKQRAEEDSHLESEITQVRDAHPNMDFTTTDETGKTLEQNVLTHAMQIGTSSFRAAFRDLMHERLIAKAAEQGKEALGKDLERKTKLGILGENSTSVLKKSKSYSKDKSYDDLTQEALEELGIK